MSYESEFTLTKKDETYYMTTRLMGDTITICTSESVKTKAIKWVRKFFIDFGNKKRNIVNFIHKFSFNTSDGNIDAFCDISGYWDWLDERKATIKTKIYFFPQYMEVCCPYERELEIKCSYKLLYKAVFVAIESQIEKAIEFFKDDRWVKEYRGWHPDSRGNYLQEGDVCKYAQAHKHIYQIETCGLRGDDAKIRPVFFSCIDPQREEIQKLSRLCELQPQLDMHWRCTSSHITFSLEQQIQHIWAEQAFPLLQDFMAEYLQLRNWFAELFKISIKKSFDGTEYLALNRDHIYRTSDGTLALILSNKLSHNIYEEYLCYRRCSEKYSNQSQDYMQEYQLSR